jgi:PAS domain S-box-containing protein
MTALLRVLYYEPHVAQRDTVRRTLEASGNLIVTVAHTSDEFERLQSAGRFDLVIGEQHAPTRATSAAELASALAEQEAWLGQVIASAMDAIITVDDHYHITLFNEAAERMFGIPAAAAQGKSLDMLLPPRYRTRHRDHVEHFAHSGETARRMGTDRELRALRANGEEFAVEASISRATRGTQTVCTVILRDVSARRRLEEQLLTAQKLEAIGRLAGGVAHDFNNLLTIVLGNAEALRAELPDGSGAESDAREIVQAAERGAALTRQLLAFARRQEADPRVVDPMRLVQALEALLRRLLGADIHLVFEVPSGIWPVVIDPAQFEQILVNLVVNARDAMPTGGRLTVTLSNETMTSAESTALPRLSTGDYVCLRVADTGEGMEPAVRDRIFEPFFTTKMQGKGTGLGLATVYGIVTQVGGSIAVWSEPGEGSRFDVYFVRADGPAEPDDEPEELPLGNATARSATVLVIEDEPAVLRLVAEALRSAGYAVHTAGGPEEARQVVAQLTTPLQLIVSDVVMPRQNGPELVAEIRAALPGVRALFMSGYADAALLERGLDPGEATLLEKPFTTKALLSAVERVLQ